jgi:5-formyltetrahydrofolate cyclo-ligase
MSFRRWDRAERPPAGRFGLPVPPPTAPGCDPADLTVVLVPLVLFGRGGARAGRGAGYYDRTFAWLRDVDRPSTPLLVGLAHDFQEAPELVPNPWDVALDVVVTPTRTLRV